MITCDQHDYIEIACTFQYPIKLTMKNGDELKCVAIDTCLDSNKNECIKVEVNGSTRLVILDDVSKMQACIDNPHFQSVSF